MAARQAASPAPKSTLPGMASPGGFEGMYSPGGFAPVVGRTGSLAPGQSQSPRPTTVVMPPQYVIPANQSTNEPTVTLPMGYRPPMASSPVAFGSPGRPRDPLAVCRRDESSFERMGHGVSPKVSEKGVVKILSKEDLERAGGKQQYGQTGGLAMPLLEGNKKTGSRFLPLKILVLLVLICAIGFSVYAREQERLVRSKETKIARAEEERLVRSEETKIARAEKAVVAEAAGLPWYAQGAVGLCALATVYEGCRNWRPIASHRGAP